MREEFDRFEVECWKHGEMVRVGSRFLNNEYRCKKCGARVRVVLKVKPGISGPRRRG